MSELKMFFTGLTLALAVLTSRPALAGDFANNGGGSAEHNFVYAYHYLAHFITDCLNNPVCDVSESDKKILLLIRSNLSNEGDAQSLLVFKTAAEENFILNGAIRVAKTGGKVGSRIFLNRDLLYEAFDGKPSAMGVPHAAGILVHELGHHHGLTDHVYLDLLGAKLKFFLLRSVITQAFDPRLFMSDDAFEKISFIPAFTVMYLGSGDKWNPDTRLLLSDSANTHDITDLIQPSLENISTEEQAAGRPGLCDATSTGSVQLRGRIKTFNLLSPRWEESYFYKPFGGKPLFNLRLSFILHVICEDQKAKQSWIPEGLQYSLNITFDHGNSQLLLRKKNHLNPTISVKDPYAR